MLVRSMSNSRSRGLKIAAVAISAVLTFLLYTEYVHSQYSIRNQLPRLGQQIFSPSRPSRPDTIPKKIWYKLGPKGKNSDIEAWTRTCIEQNPDYQHEFVTDEWADEWVQKTFATTRPDIVDVYLELTVPILKADLLRYLLLYVEGGVWSDLDVSCEGVPIDDWTPAEHKRNASIVVGWEFDFGWDQSFFHEFASWTILSRPRVSHMLMVIDDIVEAVRDVAARNGVPVGGLTTAMVGDVVDFTGPRRLTRSILKSVELTLGRPVPRRSVENIREPVLVDNVLILPGHAFADATNDFSQDGGRPGPVLVTHHYAGSWKNDKGGEMKRRRRR